MWSFSDNFLKCETEDIAGHFTSTQTVWTSLCQGARILVKLIIVFVTIGGPVPVRQDGHPIFGERPSSRSVQTPQISYKTYSLVYSYGPQSSWPIVPAIQRVQPNFLSHWEKERCTEQFSFCFCFLFCFVLFCFCFFLVLYY